MKKLEDDNRLRNFFIEIKLFHAERGKLQDSNEKITGIVQTDKMRHKRYV